MLSLQQTCIDCVAGTLHSPKDVRFLPLPDNIKEKIAKVVFDPDVDFCYDRYGGNKRDSSYDTIIDPTFYKVLMSKWR